MRQTITYILVRTTFACFGTTTKVTMIIDGDTFETETGEKVRLIGINANEISDGFAFAYLKFHFSKSTDYEQAQILSRQANKGIWGESKEETISNEQEKRETTFWQDLSQKAYFVGFLVLILLLVGIYNYFKK